MLVRLAVLLAALAAEPAAARPAATPQLSEAEFDEVLSLHELALVKFHAPWCAVCQRLKPAYVAAAAVLADEDPPIALFEVDASAEETLAKK